MTDINGVRRVFVGKKEQFAVEGNELFEDLKNNLGIKGIHSLKLFNRYDISGINEEIFLKAVHMVFSEPPVDEVFIERLPFNDEAFILGVESLPGQYNQRADSAAMSIQLMTCKTKPLCVTAKIIVINGNLSSEDTKKIEDYIINPVDSRKASLLKPESLEQEITTPENIKIITGFIKMDDTELLNFSSQMGFAMSDEDLKTIREYFKIEDRDPTETELKVLDTYWSDHCRHTTFNTKIKNVEIKGNDAFSNTLKESFSRYLSVRHDLYGEDTKRPICLMDLATVGMKIMRKKGLLDDLDVSDEINACSIKVPVETADGIEEYLIMFKNETHNHPTEIEPFGGAATCLGGAIRDPLSGRSYVYQAMRVTGSGDPTVPVSQTLPGKLSQLKITTGAAAGYSSYGNQIGLPTGFVDEIYHPGYIAKRMEIGAVIGAAPSKQVVREQPIPGDPVILLGGRTGRDGCGGATGSSKEHDEKSISTCAAEVQKGNPPTERKIQRLFRNPEVSKLIKKCNDFGAGGVCVAIGELADGIDINLDSILKKYDGLDGTELAISESQERMAVVVSPENEKKFLEFASQENLEAVTVAHVTSQRRMKMKWRGDYIVDISRDFIDTNGAEQTTDVIINKPNSKDEFFDKYPEYVNKMSFKNSLMESLKDLNTCSRKGLIDRFDSTVGAGTILMPHGGRNALTPEIGMAALIPSLGKPNKTATLMSYGFDPYLSNWSPYHGAYYAVLESVMKILAMCGEATTIRLTFQEYFEKLGTNPNAWGKPMAALLGALSAQLDLKIPSIGGKDSMSGTFNDLNVPPTLVSFAVSTQSPDKIISAAFQKEQRAVICLKVLTDENHIPIKSAVKANMETISQFSKNKTIISASVVQSSGIATAITKMCFGNNVGFEFNSDLEKPKLFTPMPGAVILQTNIEEKMLHSNPIFEQAFLSGRAVLLGVTTVNPVLKYEEESVNLSDAINSWEKPLEKVFKTNVDQKAKDILKTDMILQPKIYVPKIKTSSPRVFIPVFPGTNCEYDTATAFKKAGGITQTEIFKNNTPQDITESIDRFKKSISKCNILMIPGGFSGGDEPDGSGKFIASAFANPYISEEIQKLIQLRDGLVLGICNGFQVLIKLGLLPSGNISPIDSLSPTLTYNTIGRHISCYTQTKIISTISPWFSQVNAGDIHTVPVSHGEGRFVAPESLIKKLFENGQVATQYVDNEGNPTMEIPFNPNGAMAAIEGITSPDGRVLGKMGHSERKGEYIGINIPGQKDQRIFESGIAYFK